MVFLSVILITSWSEEIIERRKCLKMWSSLPVSWTDIAMLLSWIWYELNTRAFNSVFRMGWGRLVPTIYWDIGMGTRILWCIWLQTPSARLTLVFLMIFDIFCIWEGYKIKGNLGFWLNLHWPPHPNLCLFIYVYIVILQFLSTSSLANAICVLVVIVQKISGLKIILTQHFF